MKNQESKWKIIQIEMDSRFPKLKIIQIEMKSGFPKFKQIKFPSNPNYQIPFQFPNYQIPFQFSKLSNSPIQTKSNSQFKQIQMKSGIQIGNNPNWK